MIGLAALVLQTTLPTPPPIVGRDFPVRVSPPPPPAPRTMARGPQLLLSDTPLMGEDDYPLAALRNQASGATTVVLQVSAKGRLERCDIATSSGNDVLDATTCRLIVQRARFAPALDERGRVAPGTVRQRVRWELPPVPQDAFRLALKRGADGVLSECAITAPDFRLAYDLSECRRLDALDNLPPLTDGLPIDWAAPTDWPWPALPD